MVNTLMKDTGTFHPQLNWIQAAVSLMKYVCFHEKKMSLLLWVLPSSPCFALSTSNKHSDGEPFNQLLKDSGQREKSNSILIPKVPGRQRSCCLGSIIAVKPFVNFLRV